MVHQDVSLQEATRMGFTCALSILPASIAAARCARLTKPPAPIPGLSVIGGDTMPTCMPGMQMNK